MPGSPYNDLAAYGWRGLHLDVVRHFFSVEDVIRVMDIAENVGLNRFHLHLNDDQGWRLEIPGWPELIERSSGYSVDPSAGGYYSRTDWDRLKAAAAHRGLVLVPEIDLPGHSNSALHAISGLNPDGIRPDRYHGIGVGFSSLRIDAPDTERFIRDVYTHLVEISDGLVHVGGDESLSTEPEEYAQLLGLITGAVHDAGGTVIAWQEAAPHLGEGDLVQVWDPRLNPQPVIDAAARGVQVILSPASHTYLDMQFGGPADLGLSWIGSPLDLRVCAGFSPRDAIEGLPDSSIAGIEAALWTETITTFDEISYMLLPRLAAIGEIALHGKVDWDSFADRLPRLARTWDQQGWRWHKFPDIDWDT